MGTPKISIAPSILAADFSKLGEQVQQAEKAGADLFHIDIMDGQFVPNLTMGPAIVEAMRRTTELSLDVHLMIIQPQNFVETFAQAGANRIIVHWEACPNLHRVLQQIRDNGCKAGIALNPHTPARVLDEIMYMLDIVLVMTVNPGFGGQTLIHQTMPKIAEIRAMIGNEKRDIDLEVDGGISAATIPTVLQAGANVLIAGTTIFQHEKGIRGGIDAINASIESIKAD